LTDVSFGVSQVLPVIVESFYVPRRSIVIFEEPEFLAVAAAHDEHPPILQSFDSKWWGWHAALARVGVAIHFLCEHEIADKHRVKTAK